jgi:hypothetical protein
MEMFLATAVANLAPRGYKISGYVIKDTKTGNPLLSRGKGDKQEAIRRSIDRYTEQQGTIDFVLFLDGKTKDDNKEITKRYEWDSNEAVEIPVK